MAGPVNLYSFKPLGEPYPEKHNGADPYQIAPEVTSYPDIDHSDSFAMPVNERRPQSSPKGRECWEWRSEYFVAIIGYTLSLDQIWTFPYLCSKNGGAAFLVPYLMMMLFFAVPLMYMELALGQLHRLGCVGVWERVSPYFKGIGIAMCVVQAFISLYHNSYLASVLLIMVSMCLDSAKRWLRCDNVWNTYYCVETSRVVLQTNESMITTTGTPSYPERSTVKEYIYNHVLSVSDGVGDLNGVMWSQALCLLVVFVILYFTIFLGIRSLGKVSFVTTLYPFCALSALCIRAVMLDGSVQGLKHYLTPHWTKLKEPMVWYAAIEHVFSSLAPTFGVLLTLSSYNKVRTKSCRDAILLAALSLLTSLMTSVMVMALHGHLAQYKTSLNHVTERGHYLVYITIPEALGRNNLHVFWLLLFFTVIITMGLGRACCGLLIIVTSVCDEMIKVNKYKPLFVMFLIMGLYLASLPTVTTAGLYIVGLLNMYVSTYGMFLIAFFEIIAVNWIYGIRQFASDIKDTLEYRPNFFWQACWVFICPLCVLALLVMSILNYSFDKSIIPDYIYPHWASITGLVISVFPVTCVPVYAVYRVIVQKCNTSCHRKTSTLEQNYHQTGDVIRVTTAF